jgi:hypothetical protein
MKLLMLPMLRTLPMLVSSMPPCSPCPCAMCCVFYLDQVERKPHSELLDALEGFDNVTMGAGVRVVSLSRRRELMRARAEAARKRRVGADVDGRGGCGGGGDRGGIR